MPLALSLTPVMAALAVPAFGAAMVVPSSAADLAADVKAQSTTAAHQAQTAKAAKTAKKSAAAARSKTASRSAGRAAVRSAGAGMTARASTPTRSSLASKCVLKGSRNGLQTWPAKVRTRIQAEFGIGNIGGYRSGSGSSDHHSGRALDVMVTGNRGDRVARWVRENADDLNVKYVIWEQRYWRSGSSAASAGRRMSDRGGATANHYDHVHISFRSGSGHCPD